MLSSEASTPPLKRQPLSVSVNSNSSNSPANCTGLGEKHSATRSIDLARRLVCELSDSAARTREGYVCIAKDDLLTITNKRRLYDVTGPLEAMGIIQTTKLFIVWTGPRLGSFSFVNSKSRNSDFIGCNASFLSQYGRRMDLTTNDTVRHTSDLARVYTLNEPTLLPRYPKAKQKKLNVSKLRAKLNILMKRYAELEESVKAQEAIFNDTMRKAISITNISKAVTTIFSSVDSRLANSDQYSLPYPTGYGATPYLIILSASDLKHEFLSSSVLHPAGLVPDFVEKRRLLIQFYSSTEIKLVGSEPNLNIISPLAYSLPRQCNTYFTIQDPISSIAYEDSTTFDRESDCSTQNLRLELSHYTDQLSMGASSYIDTYSDFDLFDGI